MKTLRLEFPVLEVADADIILEIVTRVRGVVAALVSGSALEVVVASEESALLVREEVVGVLAAGVRAGA